MHRIKGEARDVYLNYVLHWLDTRPRQSAALLYSLNNGDRVVSLINHGENRWNA